jgi:peptidyl-tRNA hydrolase, PTH1 family
MMIKLIVGLGNPGVRYANTRHNAGFLVVDALAEHWNARFAAAHACELAETRVAGSKVLLQKPQSFMNLSGEAVVPLMRFYKLSAAELLVVQDDLDLPLGRLRLRQGGTAGGQRGVRDIITKLGEERFWRLKLGISRPPPGSDAADWVLRPFAPEEQPLVTAVVGEAVAGIHGLVSAGNNATAFGKIQQHLNGLDLRPQPEPSPEPKPKPASTEPAGNEP